MGLTSRGLQGYVPSAVCKERSVLSPFPDSRGCTHSLARGPFLCLHSQQI